MMTDYNLTSDPPKLPSILQIIAGAPESNNTMPESQDESEEVFLPNSAHSIFGTDNFEQQREYHL